METICGCLERITFQNFETGFTVAHLKESHRKQTTCIVGIMPLVRVGETLRCSGKWKNDLIYGHQFIVEVCEATAPADLAGIEKYLCSGLIKGIGPVFAGRIVKKFGVETLDVIDREPDRLSEVEGIGKKKIEQIKTCWSEQSSVRDLMIFLQKYGVTPTYAQKIFKTYGTESIVKVTDNPFLLAKEIRGIGFKMADTIAKKLGITQDSNQRIDAGIEHVLFQLSDEGHVCYPLEDFVVAAEKILEVEPLKIREGIDRLTKVEHIEVRELVDKGEPKKFVWVRSLFMAEVGIAREINRLKKYTSGLRQIDVQKALEWVQKKLHISLAPNQQLAIEQAVTDKVHIITGGPGTGKSTITTAILKITSQLTSKITLAAPTGRAAKRMAEITGYSASTIHLLLELDFKNGGFKKNRQNPIDCDLLIIDEASMIDTYLMYSLLKAIPNHTRVIIIGDTDQLPSVGPGNVLKDLISSNYVPTTHLTEIFRQSAGSRIVINAHRINRGSMPEICNQEQSDFFFLDAEEQEDILKHIVSLVTKRLPQKFQLNPINDIQVLAPMKKGVIGTENLNTELQKALNPKESGFLFGNRKFIQDDKVMQIRNDYDKNVFNGDIGRIKEISTLDQQMIVDFDGNEVLYNFSELDSLLHSYAVSVHKYQGSECPCVVIPIHTAHFKLLTRNLLYTAVTRGKRWVILVGTKKALALTVKNDEVKSRYTGLQQALIGLNHLF